MEYKEINYLGTNVKVSENGEVIWNGTKRNIYYNRDGYSVCSIKIPNKGWRSVRVARLVALAYIPNPNNLPEVNHKDYNRKNSNVENLEWISRIDNIRYSQCNMPKYNGQKNPNFGNRKLSKLYQENKQYALEKQSRKGLKNGRCRRIKMFRNNMFIAEFSYIKECCEYLINNGYTNSKCDSVRSHIDKSIRLNQTYKGFTFIKE